MICPRTTVPYLKDNVFEQAKSTPTMLVGVGLGLLIAFAQRIRLLHSHIRLELIRR